MIDTFLRHWPETALLSLGCFVGWFWGWQAGAIWAAHNPDHPLMWWVCHCHKKGGGK